MTRMVPSSRVRRIVFIVLGFALLMAIPVSVALYRMTQTTASVAAAVGAPIPVRVQPVAAARIEDTLGAEGVAAGNSVYPLVSTVTSRVLTVGANVGDRVTKGQRLIVMDSVLQRATVDSARVQVASAKTSLERTQSDLRNAERLYAKMLISEDDLTKAILAVSKAQADHAAALQKLADAENDLRTTVIDAPISGVVAEREVHPGTVPKAMSTLLSIRHIDPIWMQANLSEERVKYISVGQPAEVSLYSFPGRTFSGKVLFIKPQVDLKTRILTVVVALKNPQLEILPGMNGIVRFKGFRHGIRIPSVALLSPKEDLARVFVVDDADVAHMRTIKTGTYSGGHVEVKEGLQVGEKLVIVGQAGLRDQDKVRIGDEFAAK